MSLVDKWKEFVDKMNSKGVPMPMVRDPKLGVGSITATLVIVASGLCSVSIIIMMAVFFSKLTGLFVINEATIGVLNDAFSSSIQFLIASVGAYLGRKMQKDGSKVELDGEQK